MDGDQQRVRSRRRSVPVVVSGQAGRVRGDVSGQGGRSGAHGLSVAVTGAAQSVGAAAVRLLVTEGAVARVLAIDAAEPAAEPPPDSRAAVELVAADVSDPSLVRLLAGYDVVVHTALDQSAEGDPAVRTRTNVRGAQTVLTAAAAAGVRRVVLLSSAMVYGAHEDNAVPLDEAAPLRATPDSSVVGDLLEIEALAERARNAYAGLSVTVVRPAVLVGPGVDTVLTRHFESPRLLVLRGSTPRWQFCHVDDAASACVAAAIGQVDGAVTAAAEGWLSQDEVEALSGRGRLELPAGMAYGTAERLHRLGLTPAPASELHFVAHPWVVSSAALRATGWRPAYDNLTAFEVLLEEIAGRHAIASRRIGRRETATLGAAGATVAVLGTAAIVRRARRRRRG